MARNRIDFEIARAFALTLPGVEASTIHGLPALKAKGKLMACVPSHKSAEPDSLMVAVAFERRAELLAEAPEIYYAPEHYVNHASVLVRLAKIRRDALEGLLRGAWSFVTAKKQAPRRAR